MPGREMGLAINFNAKFINLLYDNHAKLVFCDAMQLLIQKNRLSVEEKIILNQAVELSGMEGFLRKSYFIYLSNGILWESKTENYIAVDVIKAQLFLELSLRILEHKKTKISFSKANENMFSLFLNQHIPLSFDGIQKSGEDYEFLFNDKTTFSVKKNEDSAITPDIDLLEADKNPFNTDKFYSDEGFVSYDQHNIPRKEWLRQFRCAYALVKEKTPSIYMDIYRFLDSIVPRGYVKAKQMSSSYSTAPGILYLSYVDIDVKQAEAIIHEVHHTIFNIISSQYKLFENDQEKRYYSAYRLDPRPIRGCFIGLHAFVAVQNFYAKLCESESEYVKTFLLLYLRNKKVIAVLDRYMIKTKEGALLFNDIKSKFSEDHACYLHVAREYPQILKEASQEAQDHLAAAHQKTPNLLD